MKIAILILLTITVTPKIYSQIDSLSQYMFNQYRQDFKNLHQAAFICSLNEEDTLNINKKFRFSHIPSFHDTANIFSIELEKGDVYITNIKCKINDDYSFRWISTQTYTGKIREWAILVSKINDALFWHLNSNSIDLGLDGSRWLVEGINRRMNQFHTVYTWSPSGSFEEIGIYLASLCGEKLVN
ncbi:MAG: hypothetical protein AAGF85_10485 [Bacteroidota bacterium]